MFGRGLTREQQKNVTIIVNQRIVRRRFIAPMHFDDHVDAILWWLINFSLDSRSSFCGFISITSMWSVHVSVSDAREYQSIQANTLHLDQTDDPAQNWWRYVIRQTHTMMPIKHSHVNERHNMMLWSVCILQHIRERVANERDDFWWDTIRWCDDEGV